MDRFVDPLGFIAATWDFMSAHGGGGIAAFVAAGIVTLVHIAIASLLLALFVNVRGVVEAVRGFVQGVNEPVETEARRY